MLIIELTNESVEGEPGLNLYWRGQPSDFAKFTLLIKDLIRTEQALSLLTISNVHLIGINNLVMSIEKDGRCLVSVIEHEVVSSLDTLLMSKVVTMFEAIAMRPSHNYVEFDNYDLREDANWIISSEY